MKQADRVVEERCQLAVEVRCLLEDLVAVLVVPLKVRVILLAMHLVFAVL